MGLCCCGCFQCRESSSSVIDSTELLHSPGIEKGSQYYTVRRISSFGRAASQEDLDGSCQDLSSVGKKDVLDINSGSLTFVPSIAKCNGSGAEAQTGAGDAGGYRLPLPSPTKKKPNWRKALHSLKPRVSRLHSKSPPPISPTFVPPITITSPDSADDGSEHSHATKHTLVGPATKLRHVLTMSDVSSVGLMKEPQVLRFKSRSMQDMNSGDIPDEGKFSDEARKLARSVGLDISLYSSSPPTHHRSAEALSQVDSPTTDDSPHEPSWGRIHFFITYYPKDKKLLVNVTQLEGLPPRNDYQDYTVMVKVQILPAEKSAKTAKLVGPDIDEDFYFSLKETHGKFVRLSVYDADRVGKHDAIGHALFHLDDEGIRATRLYTMKLYKQSEPNAIPGSILVTMGYNSDTQQLTVLIAAASNLKMSHLPKASKQTDKLNTYVKLAYYRDGEKVKSKKSAVVPHDQNPQYNHQFVMKMPGVDMADSYVVISILLKGLLRKDTTIGRIVFGPHYYTARRTYTPWGHVMMGEKTLFGWYQLYL